jgi:predicted aldo/keto reductase-like oxidoreductase
VNSEHLSRREFLQRTSVLAGLAVLGPAVVTSCAAPRATRRTAVDQVTLGKTGLKLSRLGLGTGSNSGKVQQALGQEGFNRLVRYAYDQGITYLDAAMGYRTFEWIGGAIKGLPREKLFLLTKIGGVPEKPLEVIDRVRKTYNTDYVDTLLVHCTFKQNWEDERKRMMDAVAEAQSRKWVRARGVSCHSLPALQIASRLDWVEVNLVRVNPQGVHMDTLKEAVSSSSDASHVPPVLAELKKMKANGHGVIGMKLIAQGKFTNIEDRRKSLRWVMQNSLVDAVVLGMKSREEIDEAITHINNAFSI